MAGRLTRATCNTRESAPRLGTAAAVPVDGARSAAVLINVLAVSAVMLVAATVLLVLAGRWPLGGDIFLVVGRVLDLAAVAGLATLAGVVLEAVAPGIAGPSRASAVTNVEIAAGLTGVAALATPRKWWVAGSVAFATAIVATVLYVAYLAMVTINLTDSIPSLVLGVVLLAFQVVALALMLASMFEVLDALCRPLELERLPPPPETWPVVAVQVPAHEEPPDLLLDTVTALTELEYPPDRLVIQVIDNNTTDETLWRPIETACADFVAQGFRVQFLHVEGLEGFKSGALNYGRARLPDDVEIFAVIDADYIVRPDFLASTVPFFRDPSVSFVQGPQEYRAWRTSAFYRACHTSFAYFFRVGMVSRSYRNSIIFAGTMGLVRRSAIEAIGGWDEEIITEDAEASLKILATGVRCVYVPGSLGAGIMPLTYEGLRQQRFRWAFGGMQILRKHWRELLPWSTTGLTQRQRRDYLFGGLGWLNDALSLGFALFIGVTGIGVLTGHPFVVQRLTGIGLVLPLLYIGLGMVRYVWGLRVATGVSVEEAIAALRVNLSLSWVVTLALLRASVERRGVFLRTPKFAGSAQVRSLVNVWFEALLALACVVLVVAVIRTGITSLDLTVGLLLAWTAFVFGSAVTYAIADPRRPPEWLRRKAALELGQAPPRSSVRPPTPAIAAAALAALALGAALVAESGRPPVQGPFAPPAVGIAAPTAAPIAHATPVPAGPTAPPATVSAPTVAPPAPTIPPPAPSAPAAS